jgi:hypothetical protein
MSHCLRDTEKRVLSVPFRPVFFLRVSGYGGKHQLPQDIAMLFPPIIEDVILFVLLDSPLPRVRLRGLGIDTARRFRSQKVDFRF